MTAATHSGGPTPPPNAARANVCREVFPIATLRVSLKKNIVRLCSPMYVRICDIVSCIQEDNGATLLDYVLTRKRIDNRTMRRHCKSHTRNCDASQIATQVADAKGCNYKT